MNALCDLSGGIQQGIPLSTREAERPRTIPFPANAAVELLQPIGAGLESGVHQTYIGSIHLPRKPPHREGLDSSYLAYTEALWRESRKKLMEDVSALKARYAFRNEAAIIDFCSTHAAATPFLADAAVELKRSFGQDAILALECLGEDNEPASLYAIVIWRGDAERAEACIEDFDDRWWLNQDAQPGLTFTYELA